MANLEDRLSNLEKRRIELEENVAKLQASLRHWQAWEIEYEGMKKEISELGKAPTPAAINETVDSTDVASFDSSKTLLTRKEKSSILRNDKGVAREPHQILNVLSRRIDYVQVNITTVTSLLSAAQKELVASEVLKEAKAPNEDGLPLTEIREELDENGNIISSSISTPGEAAPNAVEAIEKAAGAPAIERNGVKTGAVSAPVDTVKKEIVEQAPANSKPISNPPIKKPESPKKRVSFADDMQKASATENAQKHKASEQKLLQEISDREADELERREMAESIVPEDESPEDAALRRQMIQYNMDEVGAVVAEIDLEDDITSQSEYDSEVEIEDVIGNEVDGDDDDDEDEEDEFGRTSISMPLNKAYLKRMQTLSDKLKADAMINVGPDDHGNAKVQASSPAVEASKPKSKVSLTKKKGVRFAEDLDVQDAPEDNTHDTPEISLANLLAASSAMSGKPILRPPGTRGTEAAESPIETPESGLNKVSKIKAARVQASANVDIAKTFNSTPKPSQSPKPPSQILADKLVERPFSGLSSANASPPDEPDDLDPNLLKNQLSTEYRRLRNRQVHREGGFLRDDDDNNELADVSSTEPHEDGEPKKKMSRFKAARLGLR